VLIAYAKYPVLSVETVGWIEYDIGGGGRGRKGIQAI
jgi:hypothetical protein